MYLSLTKLETAIMSIRVLIPFANGSCETEVGCFKASLVRVGSDVITACIDGDRHRICTMALGTKMQADMRFEEAVTQEWDLILLPGGENGATVMRDCNELIAMLKRQKAAGRLYAASGASPAIVLASKDLIQPGATCYPLKRYRAMIPDASDDDVIIQDGLVTSQGVGCALVFAVVLVELLYDKKLAHEVAMSMMVDRTGQIGYRYYPRETVPMFKSCLEKRTDNTNDNSTTAAVVPESGGNMEQAEEKSDEKRSECHVAVLNVKGGTDDSHGSASSCDDEDHDEDKEEKQPAVESDAEASLPLKDASTSDAEFSWNKEERDDEKEPSSTKRQEPTTQEPEPKRKVRPGSNVLDLEVANKF